MGPRAAEVCHEEAAEDGGVRLDGVPAGAPHERRQRRQQLRGAGEELPGPWPQAPGHLWGGGTDPVMRGRIRGVGSAATRVANLLDPKFSENEAQWRNPGWSDKNSLDPPFVNSLVAY